MSARAKMFWWGLAAAALVFVIGATYDFGSPVHYSDDIRGRVIDEETGKPIQGAAVMAAWWLGLLMNSRQIMVYQAEAITNRNGEYVIPGMPPRFRPPLHRFRFSDPVIHIYKPGYRGARLTNADLGTFGYQGPFDTRSAKRQCYWNGKTIVLEAVRTTRGQGSSWQSAYDFLIMNELTSQQFPQSWATVADGYSQLPPDARPGFFDARAYIQNDRPRE